MKAVVLLSGGLDSTVCATIVADRYGAENVAALSLHYGQKHLVELECARRVAENLDLVSHDVIAMPPVFRGANSALMGEAAMPEATYEELATSEGVSPTYVPFRNANLLSAATAYAMTAFGLDATADGDDLAEVWAGMHAEDASGWAYPDCTPEFLGAMANAIYVGSYRKVRLVTPLMWDSKADVVMRGYRAGAPLGLTHSCYEGRRPACGTCPTCVGRLEAFVVAGLPDPISYE